MEATRQYYMYPSSGGDGLQAPSDPRHSAVRTENQKSKISRVAAKSAYDIYPQKKATTRSSFVAPTLEQQEPVSPIPHTQSPGTFLWNAATPRSPSYSAVLQPPTPAQASEPSPSTDAAPQLVHVQRTPPQRDTRGTHSPARLDTYEAPFVARSPKEAPSDHYNDKLERLRALLASPPPRRTSDGSTDVSLQEHSDAQNDDDGGVPGPLQLWWEQRTSGNVLISSEGDRCIADLSEARRVMEVQVSTGATDVLRRFRFPMFAFGNLGIVEGEMHFAVLIEAADLRREKASVAVSIGVASAPSGDDASDVCAYVFNSDRTISLMRTTDETQRARYGMPFGVGDRVGVHVDLTQGRLSFSVNGIEQGVAFEFIPTERPQPLFPFVSFRQEGDMVAFVSTTS